MPQRKEKQEKFGQHDAFLGLLSLLESPEPETSESVKTMIHENLSQSKDPKLLNTLVNFYVTTHSKGCFEILLHLRDPLEKQLFDKINDLMKNESTRYKSLQLLGNLVYRQPTWLYKIAYQPLMHTLIGVLKTDLSSPNLLNALYILICLIPMIPHLFSSLLLDTFDIFSRLAAWNVKKPSSLSEILNLHLQTGVYSLFHRLYGMFPCNFLSYLRSFYGSSGSSEENCEVFTLVIKPMLERVRLHPLLVTASKETELNVNRWKRMAYHDIIVECASISIDTIEGTFESLRQLQQSDSVNSEKFSSYDSTGSAHIGCQANLALTENINDNANDMSTSNVVWTPSQSCMEMSSLSSNIPSPTIQKGEFDFRSVMQSSTDDSIPLDFAVEAKPGFLKDEITEKSLLKGFLDSDEINYEEMDKEVSYLTSSEISQSFVSEARHDTPFCSTTLTLTAEPQNLSQLMSSIDNSQNFIKNTDNEESNNLAQDADQQSDAYNLASYSSFSSNEHSLAIKTPKRVRSISCPSILACSDTLLKSSSKIMDIEPAYKSLNVTSGAFESMYASSFNTQKESFPVFQKLLPSVVNPVQVIDQTFIVGFAHFTKRAQTSRYLSPPELLDHYIQQSNSAYLANLPLTEKADTDWTHFGGKPPEEEVETLKNQILLLHNMLLFERHRKDIHSERNRRILGRAKKIRMQEECISALKSDISSLKEENSSLRKDLSNQYKLNQQLHLHKKLIKDELDTKLTKFSQDNTKLLLSYKQIQTLLVSQKEENDEIRDCYKKAEKDVAACKCQLKYAKHEILSCQKMKQEAIFLSKQMVLMQELNAQYKSKLEKIKKVPPNVETKLMINALQAEVKDLKKNLSMQTVFLDSSKGRIAELENTISDRKFKDKEKASFYEAMKSHHEAEVKAREDRIKDIEKVTLEKDSYILKMHSEIDGLKEKLGLPDIDKDTLNDSNGSDSGLQSLHQQSGDRSSGIHKKEEI